MTRSSAAMTHCKAAMTRKQQAMVITWKLCALQAKNSLYQLAMTQLQPGM
jgi:hypothetical protein